MGHIIEVDFRTVKQFSADVFSLGTSRQQFDCDARSVDDAYRSALRRAVQAGIADIRAIAVYVGTTRNRLWEQDPVKIWQNKYPYDGEMVEDQSNTFF